MNRLLAYVDDHMRVEYILYAFWMLFWLLNGFDKFFNGDVVQLTEATRTAFDKGMTREMGWYGVSRDAKFIWYFERLYLPAQIAVVNLYMFAVLQIIVGSFFAVMLFWRDCPKTVHRVCFKLSMVVFLMFSTGDILFGDRAELWEHGTFMVMTMLTYMLFLSRYDERREIAGPGFGAADLDKDERLSTQEFDQMMDERKKS